MEVLIWVLILGLFVLSLVGVFYPILPSVVLLWAGFLLYHFGIDSAGLSSAFWWSMGGLTLFLFVSDYVANAYFVKKYGGSKWSMWGSVVGLIVFPLFLGPLGILLGPFLPVFVIELLLGRKVNEAFKAASGSFFSLIGSSLVKLLIQLGMIGWFLLEI